jgi:sigma-B regulation protein RsbU (phosphoserine phosphatase)
MAKQRGWREELKLVVDMMRDLSRIDDPQAAAVMYAERLRQTALVPMDERLSVSRRNLKAPFYRITRSSTWKEHIDPWKEPQRLPTYSSGLLGELVYSEEPAVIDNLPDRLSRDDPAYELLRGFQLLLASPQFDNGESLNLNVILVRDAATFPMERLPYLVWMSNLWGRSVLNLLLRRELEQSHERKRVINAQLDRELRVVGQIQMSLLPSKLPKVSGLELAADYQTSERAGGDYYDLFDCGDGRWGILIADVSGHGAPAAVIMAITHAIAHLHPGRGTPTGELLQFVNASLASTYTNGNGSFVTAFYGIYDPATRRLVFARAGHNAPRLLRRGKIRGLDGDGGLPLGISAQSTYGECFETLEPGDLLLLYTDGIVEARNAQQELFGVERLDDTLAKADGSAPGAVAAVLAALNAFTGAGPLLDDRTLLAAAAK